MISPPVAVEPVNATLSTPGCLTRYAPVVGPSPGTMLIAPAGKPTSLASSASRSTLSGVCGSGLRTTVQPAASAGESFQTRHQQRVVPRHDLRADADRLLERVAEERAADRIRAAADRADHRGEEAEVLDGAADLRLDRRDRLADVARLELRELLAVRGDRVGERVQQAGALVRRRPAPRPVESRPRGLDRAVDVGLAAERDAGERLAGGGLQELTGLAGGRLDRLAVDEEAVLLARRDRHEPENTGCRRAPRVRLWDPRRAHAFASAPKWVHIGSEDRTKETEWRSTSKLHGSLTGTSSCELLREHGLEAEPHDELEIVVQSDDVDGEVFHEVESLIMQIGAPFVPIKHEGVIYVRPPVG